MVSGTQESATIPPEFSAALGGGGNDAGDFECNICFELAQDPVITLCGHLYCWPCLFRWLRLHSHSHECPVCKALIKEEKVIPLYGRGKASTDPRLKPIPGVEIPTRPAGQRPQTAPTPSPAAANFSNFSFGLLGGFMPMATATFGNIGMSAGFGGLTMSPLLNLQFHGFPGGNVHGATPAFTDGVSGPFHGNHGHRTGEASQEVQADNNLKMLLLIIFLAVIYVLLYN